MNNFTLSVQFLKNFNEKLQFYANFRSFGRKMPKIKNCHFLTVFGLYLLNALTKNLKIKKIKEHFERAFQRCAEIYFGKKFFWGTKTIFDLGHLT